VSDEQLPRDPDWNDVPSDLVLLHGLGPSVMLVDEDGESWPHEQLVIVPDLFGHARRLQEG
jgi:hypothetical protein